VHSHAVEVTHDTLQVVMLQEVYDTLREVTTITVQLNAEGDTLRMTTVTDRTRAIDRERLHDVREKGVTKRDTLYSDKQTDRRITAVGPGTEIDSSGNITTNGHRLHSTLKWIFLILLAIIALLLTPFLIRFLKRLF